MKDNIWVRHGKSPYGQGKTSIERADDLTPAGIRIVKNEAKKIAGLIKKGAIIFSSPYGRTLHSAKIIKAVLFKYGLGAIIIIEEDLRELNNFSWKLFQPLVEGGEVNFNGKNFLIDAAETNPNGLKYPDYIIKDEISQIPMKTMLFWPLGYIKKILSFESYYSVVARRDNFLSCLPEKLKIHGRKYPAIIVTHDALLLGLNKEKSVKPGSFIVI